MIEEIRIEINNTYLNYNIIINVKKLVLNFNNNIKEITEEKIQDLLRIIRTWDNYYGSSNIIDDIRYSITIIIDKEVDALKSDGVKPHNFDLFMNWVNDLC